VVVDFNARYVALVTRDDGTFSFSRSLLLHVMVRSSVEVIVGPSKELRLFELRGCTRVREAEFCVLFKHF